MSDDGVRIFVNEMGYNPEHRSWMFDFVVEVANRHWQFPIAVDSNLGENERRSLAIRSFQELTEAVALEARNL